MSVRAYVYVPIVVTACVVFDELNLWLTECLVASVFVVGKIALCYTVIDIYTIL